MCTKENIQVRAQETKPCQACQVKVFTKFCSECGRDLTTPKEPVKPAENTTAPPRQPATPVKETTGQPDPAQKCGSCGYEISPDARFCPQCGSEAVQKSTYDIVCTCKDKAELTASITKDEFIIGQADDCDLVIPDGYVSRHHTRLFLSDGRLMLEDMDSSNGTFIRVHEPVGLTAEDEILIGTNILRLKA